MVSANSQPPGLVPGHVPTVLGRWLGAAGDGSPPLCHPGERILASGSVQLPRFTLLESGSLLVSPAHLADAGTYTCLATNSRGVDEASADLVVWGKAPVALRSGMPGMGTGTLLGCLEGC